MTLTGLRLRGILDSRGEVTVEAEVVLDATFEGRGSCPRAIAPGRRERPIGGSTRLGTLPEAADRVWRLLRESEVDSQAALDTVLMLHVDSLGVSTALAVSVAYARAGATAAGQPLWRYLADLLATTAALPRLLVNVFSGGIHATGDGYQQIMVIPRTGSVADDIDAACRVWAAAADLAAERFGEPRLSASSGLVVPVDSARQLGLLDEAIDRSGLADQVSVGVDVAAEHLYHAGRYRLGGQLLSATELGDVLCAQSERYRLSYVEDPFDAVDEAAWRALRADIPAQTCVVGDDLFATDAGRITPELADGILLKPSQIGTVSGLAEAADVARLAGLTRAVSHRSGETDDTVICDLATAIGADLIKVGGPRRGDRLAKYNQLLRLAEQVPTSSPAVR